MEVITELFSTIWESLKLQDVPILEISFVDFLLGIFAIKIVISVFNYLLSKSNNSSNDKSNGD